MRYEDLEVFKKSHLLVIDIYKITDNFPNEERYRLSDQLIRASYSIPSNIAEGNSRSTTKDYINFLFIARGSANEIKYFLLLSRDLCYIENEIYKYLNNEIGTIIKMLSALIKSLRVKNGL